MSHEISLLSQETIDKIAAGEVIERPSSVVKELVENAIDAGANAVTIEIKDGGMSLIRITDNGEGIDKNQVRTAFLRHATSKIRSVDDLLKIGSLGFRGEALSSIAAVCQVELITKTAGSLTGVRYTIEGSREKGMEEIGAPEGSTFLVRNIFYNTPARKKFLKSAVTEAGYVSDLAEHLALSHPEISFKFITNGQTRLHTSGNNNLKDIIYSIYGRDIAAALLPVDVRTEGIHLHGFIGKPTVSRGNRNYENYFVNNRYIKSSVIAKAIEDAYSTFMMQHRYPFTVLKVDVDSEMIDVNVHPQKMDIRFADNAAVYRMVQDTVRAALTHRELIPSVSVLTEKEERKQKEEERKAQLETNKRAPEPFEKLRRDLLAHSTSPYQPKYPQRQPGASRPDLTQTRPQGQPAASAPASPAQTGANVPPLRPTAEAPAAAKPETSSAPELKRTIPNLRQTLHEPASKTIYTPEMAAKDAESIFAMPSEEVVRASAVAEPEFTYGANKTEEPAAVAEPGAAAEQNAVTEPDAAAELTVATEADAATDTAAAAMPEGKPQQMELFDDRLLSKKNVREHRLIGQIFDTYWLIQFRDNLYIIDQHAAHEKVMYERLQAKLKDHEFTTQQVSPPIILTLTMQEENLLNTFRKIFEEVGFEIEHFGGKEYAITGIPDNLFGITDTDLFTQMLDSLSDMTRKPSAEALNAKLATMACKAAVKGNNKLSAAEADALIGELLELENPYNCPHGRPTIISMSKYELEKKFKRIV